LDRRPLVDASGAHVRAGSGLCWWGERLAVVQDDTRSLAWVDPRTGEVELVGFGGFAADAKQDKLDLESLLAHDGSFLAFGSGSTERREVIVRFRPGEPAAVCVATRLYRLLRETTAFSGSELNVEGATVLGNDLWLFQRGNGKPARGLEPVNATARLDLGRVLAYLAAPAEVAPPALEDVCVHELGTLGGVRLTFTDAAAYGGRVFYLASAEASPDSYRDGVVVGSAIGVLGEGEPTRIEDASGRPFTGKAEGLALSSATLAYAVLDADDPAVPADLCSIELSGF
jgi:hypothetical protein